MKSLFHHMFNLKISKLNINDYRIKRNNDIIIILKLIIS